MLNVLLVVMAYTLICLYEVPGLIREKSWRDFASFTAFLLPALILSIILAAGVKLPLITPAIYKAFTPLLTWLGII
jgi:hypothetical protein